MGKPQADLSICGGVLRARSHEYHKEVLDNLREASRLTGKLCAVLLDTKGPEVGPLSLSLSLSLSLGWSWAPTAPAKDSSVPLSAGASRLTASLWAGRSAPVRWWAGLP